MDICTISASTPAGMKSAGRSLKDTLYALPTTIYLRGALGVGKTTFLQGFGESLGILEGMASPTYALEQRYQIPRGELLHLDLYRLSPDDARRLLASSEDHLGIRCVEWAERANIDAETHAGIHISMHEMQDRRRDIFVTFCDAPIPSSEDILQWRQDVRLPRHIAFHCDVVTDTCITLCHKLKKKGRILRSFALMRAAAAHDLFRFVDFRPGAGPAKHVETAEDLLCWDEWKKRYPGLRHEAVCAQFLREKGYSLIADIVEPHGLVSPAMQRTTMEQKVLFYADKRVQEDRVVTVEERFADFAKRYGNGKVSPEQEVWLQETRKIEAELFPEGAPF